MERDDGGGLQRIATVLKRAHPELVITKRRLRKVESIECVRLKRETARQNLGFASRPFVLCGLPVRRPPRAAHRSVNLRIINHFQICYCLVTSKSEVD